MVGWSNEHGQSAALLYVDLDGFNEVNDALGHHCGDSLLIQVGDRLRAIVRAVDVVARIGGDEFAVVQTMIDTSEATGQLCRRLVHALAEPFEVEGHSVKIGASIGVAVTPSDPTDPSSLMRLADNALYRAKAAGRGSSQA